MVLKYFQGRTDGFFIEVGANHPTNGSLTWPMEQKGWSGIVVEPQEKHFRLFQQSRPKSHAFRAACGAPENTGKGTLHIPKGGMDGFATLSQNADDHGVEYDSVEHVDVVTLDSLIDQVRPARIDFVSIDTEGTELEVLKGFSLRRHKPALILIEDKGTTLKKHRHLRANGYKLVKRTELNNWYVPEETRFEMTGFVEKLKLWRKVFGGFPFRKFRHWRHH